MSMGIYTTSGERKKTMANGLLGGVRNFVFGHNMSKRCMYANQKETPS